ncbi:ABC transporter ATP-binding protein [Kibdelosporangium aridum]|uniref:ABC transporter ATP-binding protein n=1 Tax=Kibdelosporangium aridum TaxID=2030 RepID=A0A428Z278_KIBAR|nr:ATP-binding cassette domain-containing protein [Kibdelosporangium aridum]RSM79413.1 ABC transporter ATP-binding protein [Kibdelosporangium aridum]
MQIRAERVGVDGPHGPLLLPTSLSVHEGEVTLVTGEPGAGHTTLALALAGRIRPSHGTVTLDGEQDAAKLRKHVVLVDAPGVNEPEDGLKLGDAIAEELMHAGQRANRKAVREWLRTHDAEQYVGERVDNVPPQVRTRLLVEAASSKADVRALLLDQPDRHVSDAQNWWPQAISQAERGLAVVVLCAPATAQTLPAEAVLIGAVEE